MLALIVASFLSAEAADSFCVGGTNPVNAASVWIVDDTINTDLSVGRSLDDGDVRAMADRVIQSISRRARARVRFRVTTGNCSPGSNRCIAAVSNSYDSGDLCNSTGNALASATCSLGSCSMRLCKDNIPASSWVDGTLEYALTHEFGHMLDLEHPNNDSQVDTCITDSECNAGEDCFIYTVYPIPLGFCVNGNGDVPCRVYDTARTGCSTTNGCGAESMCSRTDCGSSFYTDGDVRGVRATYSGATTRTIYLGDEILPLEAAPGLTVNNRNTVYPPRIDCAKGTASIVNQCAMAFTPTDAQIGIVILDDHNGSGDFDRDIFLTTFDLPSGDRLLGPADIAVNLTGSTAWMTWSDSDNGGQLNVGRFNLSNGTRITTTLDEHKNQDGVLIDTIPVLPPRISFISDSPNCAVVIALNRIDGSDAESYLPQPGRSFHQVCEVSGLLTVVSFDIENLPSDLAHDFDFDCNSVPTATDTCVIVGHRREIGTAAGHTDFPWSRDFSFIFAGGLLQPQFGSAWAEGTFRTNSIIGVSTVFNTGLTPNDRLLVSAGRAITSGTDAANTRIIERGSRKLSTSPIADDINKSDAQTCATSTDGPYTLPALTMHGGYSWSFCPTCSGAPGRLISAHMGRSGSDTFCF